MEKEKMRLNPTRIYQCVILALLLWISSFLNNPPTPIPVAVDAKEQQQPEKQQQPPPLIVYVSQGPASSYQRLISRFNRIFGNTRHNNTWKFFYHSYDRDCEGCIFQNGTTYAEGWNLVGSTAMLELSRKQTTASGSNRHFNFKYLVRFDDDLRIVPSIDRINDDQNKEDVAWFEIHEMLLADTTVHPIIRPQDKPRVRENHTVYQTCMDGHYYAVQPDHMSLYWPFSTRGKKIPWFNDVMAFMMFEKCYPGGVLVDHQWQASNPEHRYGVSHQEYIEFRGTVYNALNEELPELKPWSPMRAKEITHRCHVSRAPSLEYHPRCRTVLGGRFTAWLNELERSRHSQGSQ